MTEIIRENPKREITRDNPTEEIIRENPKRDTIPSIERRKEYTYEAIDGAEFPATEEGHQAMQAYNRDFMNTRRESK